MTEYQCFMKLINDRYSCRGFKADTPVDKSTVVEVIEAARLAPSATNRQPWTFVAVTDFETRSRLLAKSRQTFIDAPVLIVACGHHSEAWHRPSDGKDHTDVDVSIAIEHLCLAASSLGLGSCWVCSFDVEAARQSLCLPDDVEPVALIPLGYPINDAVPEKKRKSIDQILKWEKF